MANIFSNLFDFVKNGVSGINQIAYEMGLPEGESYGKSLLDKQKMELLRLQQQKEAADLIPAQYKAEILQDARNNVTKAANGYSLPNGDFDKYMEFKKEKQSPYQLTQTLQPSINPFNSKGQIDLSKQTLGKPQQPDPTSLLAQSSTLDPNSNIGKLFYGKTQVENRGNGVYHYINPNWSQGEVDTTTGQRTNETKGVSGFNISTILKNPTNSGYFYNVADIQNGTQFNSGTKGKINQLTQDYYNTFGEIPVISHDNNNGAFFTSKTFDNKKQDWLKQKAGSLGLTTGDLTDKGLSLIDSSVERNNQLNTNFSGDYVKGVEPVVRTGNKITTTSNESLDSFMNALGEQESGSNYDTNPNSSGAMGKYQILKTNWPTWAEEAGLSRDASMTPENQELVARHKVQEYYKQFGNWKDVATAWYAGPGEVQSPTFDHSSELNNGPSVSRYVNEVMGKMGKTTTSEPVYKNQAQPNDYLQSVTDISQNFDSDNPANSIDNLRNNYLKYRNTGKIELGKLNNDALYTLQQWGVENPESIINSWNDDITKSNIGQLFNKGQQPNPDFQFSTLFKNGNLDLNAPNKTINIPGMGYENAMRQYGSVILNELLNDKASAGYYMNPQQQQQAALIKNGLSMNAKETNDATLNAQKFVTETLEKMGTLGDKFDGTAKSLWATPEEANRNTNMLNAIAASVGLPSNMFVLNPSEGMQVKNFKLNLEKLKETMTHNRVTENIGMINANTNIRKADISEALAKSNITKNYASIQQILQSIENSKDDGVLKQAKIQDIYNGNDGLVTQMAKASTQQERQDIFDNNRELIYAAGKGAGKSDAEIYNELLSLGVVKMDAYTQSGISSYRHNHQ